MLARILVVKQLYLLRIDCKQHPKVGRIRGNTGYVRW